MKIQNVMKRFVVAGAVLVGLASAGVLALPAFTPVRTPAPHAADHWDRTQGGGIDLRPRLIQGSVFSGTTHTGTKPEILFWARHVSEEALPAVMGRLEETASFIDEQGRGVAAVAKVGPPAGPPYSHRITLSPVEALRADAWYTLNIERDLAIVVGGPEDRAEEMQGPKRVRFFTGSAPQIRRIIRSADPGKPTQIDIVMSEPVELGSVVREGLRIQLGGQALPGCVAWDSGCVRADHAGRTNAFSFRPAAPLREKGPSDLLLSMGAGVQGEGRTVGEGAGVTQMSLDTSTGQPRHVVAVAAGTWSRCSDSDDVLCWRSAAQ